MSALFPLIVASQLAICRHADDVVNTKSSGDSVIRDVVNLIKESEIFPDDHNFLNRLAHVQEDCAETDAIDGLLGGIWKMGEGAFLQTQDTAKYPSLTSYFAKVKEQFGIDWSRVAYEDLNKPLYSGLAARIFVSIMPTPIPTHVQGQARFWKKYNMTIITDAAERCFIDVASTVRGDPHVSQRVPGSDKSLCYDVFGEDGDIYSFFVEPSMGLTVNARLAAARQNKVAKFVWDMAVFKGKLSIFINPDMATVNSKRFDWSRHTSEYLTAEEDIYLSIDHQGILIDFEGLIWINVKRTGSQNSTHMDFGIHHIGDIHRDARGILGDVSRSVTISEEHSGASLEFPGTNHAPVKLHHQGRCWKLRGSSDPGFNQILDNNKISCLSC